MNPAARRGLQRHDFELTDPAARPARAGGQAPRRGGRRGERARPGGRRRRRPRRRRAADDARHDLPDRVEQQADHRRGDDAARRRWSARPGRPGRALAPRAGVADGGAHPGVAGRRRGARPSSDHRARPADVPERPRVGRRLLPARGGGAGRRAAAGAARAPRRGGPERVDADPGHRAAPAPPRRRVALQHRLRRPRRAGRPRRGAPVRRVPGRADLRPARHARHRLPRVRLPPRPVHNGLPARRGRTRGHRPARRPVEHGARLRLGFRRPRLHPRRPPGLPADAARGRRGACSPRSRWR